MLILKSRLIQSNQIFRDSFIDHRKISFICILDFVHNQTASIFIRDLREEKYFSSGILQMSINVYYVY